MLFTRNNTATTIAPMVADIALFFMNVFVTVFSGLPIINIQIPATEEKNPHNIRNLITFDSPS